jgi:hypothetical protein
MDKIFETAIFNRKLLTNFLKDLTFEQLITIPENFNNSIFWNIAHILVTQQLLTYKMSELPLNIEEDIIEKYKKGSKATLNVSKEEVDYVRNKLVPSVIKLQEDYKKGLFKEFTPYLTSVNISLNNIDDALKFSAFHDGIHLGVILSIKKLV